MNFTTFLVGADGPTDALINNACQTGFDSVKPYPGLGAVERELASVPTVFFLFSPVIDIFALNEIIRPLRSCKRRDVRFSPMIYFCNHASPELIRDCIEVGFDDVVTMPFSHAYFQERLLQQLDRAITYCETGIYFGPVRGVKTAFHSAEEDDQLRTQPGRHIQFVRRLSSGVEIVGDSCETA